MLEYAVLYKNPQSSKRASDPRARIIPGYEPPAVSAKTLTQVFGRTRALTTEPSSLQSPNYTFYKFTETNKNAKKKSLYQILQSFLK